MIQIRDAKAEDEAAWRGLWADYAAFYGETLPEAVTAATWRRILEPASSLSARLALSDGAVVGFSVSVLHETSWSLAPVCYLEDLFVTEAARGRGAGRGLIQDLVEMGRARGWARLYWVTRWDNPARELYDAFTPADEFVRYRMKLD